MYGYKRLFLLIFIMACTCFMVGAIAIYVLYLAALDEERARLTDTVRSQARLIESVARFDRDQASDYRGGAEAATLLQIKDAHRQYQGFGDTGGFAFGRREGANIVFLHSHRQGLEKPPPLPSDSRLAEPMRRALRGERGTMVGLDYRGATVLAAYEPVSELDMGIVAKIDLAEVRAPFVRAGLLAGGLGTLVVLLGSFVFYRLSDPMIRQLRESEARYRLIADNVGDVVWAGEIEGLAELVGADGQPVVETGVDELLDGWKYTFISPSIEQVLGYDVDEAMRLKPRELLTDVSYSALQRAMYEEVAIEQSGQGDVSRQQTLELEHVTKDGGHRWCEVAMKFLREENGRIGGVVGCTRDITTRKDLEREVSMATVHEQQRIGQELHDGLGQHLLGIGLMTKGLETKLRAKGLPEAESAGELVQHLTDAQDHVRKMIEGIRPVGVDAAGLMAALSELGASTQGLADVQCTFECREPVRVADDHTATQLFYVAQEAVRNAVKHARAKQITIGLAKDERLIRFWVGDDGVGWPAESARTDGMGLRIMHYRASLIGGTLAVAAAPGGGTVITCVLPVV